MAPLRPGGTPGAFLTMEYLDGTTLSERIDASGPLPIQQALEIALQLCAALRSIHAAGVVHRDLKPRNIMLVPGISGEKAVVMDFWFGILILNSRGYARDQRNSARHDHGHSGVHGARAI